MSDIDHALRTQKARRRSRDRRPRGEWLLWDASVLGTPYSDPRHWSAQPDVYHLDRPLIDQFGEIWLKPRDIARVVILRTHGAGAWTEPGALMLHSHALAPLNELPVLEVVSATYILAVLTLGLGKVVHDYLA
jgi:hypothetical protein